MSRRSSLALTVALLALALPAGAQAADGSTTIALRGAALQSLHAQGVAVRAGAPAQLVKGKLRLPVRGGVVESTATINLGGSLRLRRGHRTLVAQRLQARLGRTVRIVATMGGTRLTLFTANRRPSLNAAAGTASIAGSPLTLTRNAGKVIKRKLRLRRAPRGRAGVVTVDALIKAPSSAQGPAVQGTTPTPGSGGQPQSGVISDEPPLLARPATAVPVSGNVIWTVRDSWVRYIAAGNGSSPLGAAVPALPIPPEQHACPDSPASAPALVYSYTMPLASGWHDPVSGQTALYTSGGVRFLYATHGIDLEVSDLEIELNGAASRVIARFGGRLSTTPGNKRAVLVNLANAGPALGAPPTTVRGSLPADGSLGVFAGFYAAQAGFGCVTVNYST